MAKKSRVHYSSSGGGDVGSVVNWFKQIMERVEDGNSNAISQAVSDGENTMKHLIASRGTAKSGKAGRIETGNMHNSVTSSFNQTARGNAVGRFGWLKNREDYFGFQEGGFEHARSGVDVEGMYAMVDAYELVKQELEQAVRNNLRGA